jgi:hypothetical protein
VSFRPQIAEAGDHLRKVLEVESGEFLRMRHLMASLSIAALLASAMASTPARADDGRIAAGVAGGLLGGLFLGSVLSRPHYYVAPAPAPIYYDVPPPPPPERCYWTRGEPVWDGYLGVWRRPRIQVCD